MPMRIINIVGARPNFVKIAPIMRAFGDSGRFEALLVHTGQHYDQRMSDLFFRQLGIPQPDENLGIGSGSHAVQTADIMKAFEPVLQRHAPDAVLVVGDVNSTLACSLVAAKAGCPVIHVEAGLRSFDRTMPEEINRVVTDAISDVLFCTEPAGVENLRREGIDDGRIHLVGNVMIDSLLAHRQAAEASGVLRDLGMEGKAYGVLTLHRAGNVDSPAAMAGILQAVRHVQAMLPLVFPIHPRTRQRLDPAAPHSPLAGMDNLILTEPLGYLDFLKLMANARLVITDSGGIQEETAVLKVPCVTVRENTERPITITVGANRLAGTSAAKIIAACQEALAQRRESIATPPLWDGQAARRIVEILGARLASMPKRAACEAQR